MAKVEFLLKSKVEKINFSDLEKLRDEYFQLLGENTFPASPVNSGFSEMIHYFKRKDEKNPIKIGPYKNISPFEAANRIASDLVIINGLIELISKENLKDKTFTVRLGTTHIKDKGDFTIHHLDGIEWEGEAFNVAPSFLKSKLQKTFKKWSVNDLKYILVNDEAFESYYHKDQRIVRVSNWDKLDIIHEQ